MAEDRLMHDPFAREPAAPAVPKLPPVDQPVVEPETDVETPPA